MDQRLHRCRGGTGTAERYDQITGAAAAGKGADGDAAIGDIGTRNADLTCTCALIDNA